MKYQAEENAVLIVLQYKVELTRVDEQAVTLWDTKGFAVDEIADASRNDIDEFDLVVPVDRCVIEDAVGRDMVFAEEYGEIGNIVMKKLRAVFSDICHKIHLLCCRIAHSGTCLSVQNKKTDLKN